MHTGPIVVTSSRLTQPLCVYTNKMFKILSYIYIYICMYTYIPLLIHTWSFVVTSSCLTSPS